MKPAIQTTMLRIVLLAALAAAMSTLASAQHGFRITKRATFKKGEVAMTVAGRLPNPLEAGTLASLTLAAPARLKYAVEKKITFEPRVTSTRVVSMLPNNIDIHEYHFRACANQRMRITLVARDEHISFYIGTIPDGYVMTEDIAVRSFNDTLPHTGEYKPLVSTDTSQGDDVCARDRDRSGGSMARNMRKEK